MKSLRKSKSKIAYLVRKIGGKRIERRFKRKEINAEIVTSNQNMRLLVKLISEARKIGDEGAMKRLEAFLGREDKRATELFQELENLK